MAASIWARAARASASSLRSALRAPTYLRSTAQPVLATGQAAARRWRSAEAAQLLPFDAEAEPYKDTAPQSSPKASQPSDVDSFKSLGDKISRQTLEALTVKPLKLTTMTSVQSAVFRLLPDLAEPYDSSLTQPRDLLVRAKTGTGKTVGFLVPAIEARLKVLEAHGRQAVVDAGLVNDPALEARARRVYARTHVGTLIISPTRELATQIAVEAQRVSANHDGFGVQLFVGGNSKARQLRDFVKGRRDIVVATPGRLRDLLENEPEVKKSMEHTQTLVLDEADTLLDMGFRDEIDAIIDFLPRTPERQTFMFSATVSTAIKQIARAALAPNHRYIDCVDDSAPPVHLHIPQYHTVLPSAGQQLPHILRLIAQDQLENPKLSKIIIFLPTTKMTQLYSTLIRELAATCLPQGRSTRMFEIHSKRNQANRDRTSDDFRNANRGASILISSDVSARGIDYPGVTRVIQVGVPSGTDQYVHRVGRTGRGDEKKGRADLVLLPWEIGFVSWQLKDMPLKPLTTNELKLQVTALAQQYDKQYNPQNEEKVAIDNRGRVTRRPAPIYPYAPALDNVAEQISGLLSKVDQDSIKEVMVSLLGYYISRTGDLRVQSSVVAQGLKDWSVEAMGLPTPPHISEKLLQKLGIRPERTGRSKGQTSYVDSPSSSWSSRNQRSEGRDRDNRRDFRRSDDDRSSGRRDEGRSFGRRDEGRSFGRRDEGHSFGRRDEGRSSGRRDEGRSFGAREEGRSFERHDGNRSSFRSPRPTDRSFGTA